MRPATALAQAWVVLLARALPVLRLLLVLLLPLLLLLLPVLLLLLPLLLVLMLLLIPASALRVALPALPFRAVVLQARLLLLPPPHPPLRARREQIRRHFELLQGFATAGQPRLGRVLCLHVTLPRPGRALLLLPPLLLLSCF